MAADRFDRRAFLGRFTLTAGGVAASAFLPVSLLEAAGRCDGVRLVASTDPCGDWCLDDMCGAYPPYAFRLDTGVTRHIPLASIAAPVDRDWVS
jgi:hypothetical protein